MTLIKIKSRGTDNVSTRRNLFINGDMKVQQRYAAGTVTQATNSSFVGPDRYRFYLNGGGAYTVTQDGGHQADTGHDKAIKIAVTTADTSIAAGDYYSFLQRIEAKSVQELLFGTSSAKSVTLSFWVRATKTGTQALSFAKQGTGQDYRHIKEYTINASNTWEHKTITIPGLTASTMENDASTYFQVSWMLKYGSTYQGTKDVWTTSSHYTTAAAVNNMDTVGNVFYITGIQVEVGDSASDFEHRSFGEELALCQRYFFQESTNADDVGGIFGIANGTVRIQISHGMPVQMRAKPSLTLTSASIRVGDTVAQGVNTTSGTISVSGYTGTQRIGYSLGGFTGLNNYRTYLTEPRTSDSMIGIPRFNAEL